MATETPTKLETIPNPFIEEVRAVPVPVDEPNYDPLKDTALKSAWERLEKYDLAALRQKQEHIRLRVIVLLLGFVTSLLSVFIGSNIPTYTSGYNTWRFVLFALPLATAGIMAYATQLIPNQMWVKHRFSAEMIRREVFRYRMNAGQYYGKSRLERQKILLDVLRKADAYSADAMVDVFTEPSELSDQQFAEKLKAMSGSDGKTLSLTDYIEKRLDQQSHWYSDKSYFEHRNMRWWQMIGLFIGSAGSLLAFQGYIVWVAVTTSAAVTINALANLRMYGRTYFLYGLSARRLREQRDEWETQSPENYVNTANIAVFVDNVEKILHDEIERWVEQTQQALSQIELEIETNSPGEAGPTLSGFCVRI